MAAPKAEAEIPLRSILARRGEGMTQVEILEELKKFTISERLTIVEAALRLIRKDLQEVGQLRI